MVDIAPVFGVYRRTERHLFTILIFSLMLTVIATLIRSPDTDKTTGNRPTAADAGCCDSFLAEDTRIGKALNYINDAQRKSILLFIMKIIITIFTITGRGILINLSLSSELTKWPTGDVVFIIGECMVSYVEIIDFIYEQKTFSGVV